MKTRNLEIPIEPDLRDQIKKEKRELTYSEFFRQKLNLKKGEETN